MSRRSPARKRPAVHAAPRRDIVQSSTPAQASGGFTALWESVAQEILAVTYWFDPAPHPKPYPRRSSKSSQGVAPSPLQPVSVASMRASGL